MGNKYGKYRSKNPFWEISNGETGTNTRNGMV